MTTGSALARLYLGLLAAASLLLAPSALAGGYIYAVPGNMDVGVGQTFAVELHGNFDSESTLGGGIDILFLPGVLEVVDIVQAPIGEDGFRTLGPVDNAEGSIRSLAFGDFNGLGGNGSFLVATITFRVLAPFKRMPVRLQNNEYIAGPFVSNVSYVEMEMQFTGATVEYSTTGVVQPIDDLPSKPRKPGGD